MDKTEALIQFLERRRDRHTRKASLGERCPVDILKVSRFGRMILTGKWRKIPTCEIKPKALAWDGPPVDWPEPRNLEVSDAFVDRNVCLVELLWGEMELELIENLFLPIYSYLPDGPEQDSVPYPAWQSHRSFSVGLTV